MKKLALSPIQSLLVVLFSFILASVVNIYPMGLELSRFRPMALIMVLVFWLIHRPRYVSVGAAFLIGILADLLLDTRLGQQAFAAVIMTLAIRLIGTYLRQMNLSIAWMVATTALVVFQLTLWIVQYITQNIFIVDGLFSLVISILTWPIIYMILYRFSS